MAAYEGRVVRTPTSLRAWVADVRALDMGPRWSEEVAATFLPSGVPALTAVTSPDGGFTVFASGPRTRAKVRQFVPARSFVHLALEPAAALSVLGTPLHGLVDRSFAIDEVWGRAGRELTEALAPLQGDSKAMLALLEKHLVRRASKGRGGPSEIVRRATRSLGRSGATARIEAVARGLGVDARRLREIFHEHVGLSPKRYARIARVRRVVKAAGSASWADLAIAEGFYDQAHMISECRSLLGLSPGELLVRRASVAADRWSPARRTREGSS